MTENDRPIRRRPAVPSGGTGGRQPARGSRPAAPGPRPSASAPARASGGRLPAGFPVLLAVGLGIIALGLVLQGLMPGGFPLKADRDAGSRAEAVSEIRGDGPIRLNEIMTANGGVMVDGAGETPDWIEVANVGSRPVDLKGYLLAKQARAGNVFAFPSHILQPGECALVFADSVLSAEDDGEWHAPFRLSSSGDALMLFNAADVAVDTVNIPALGENEVYARANRDSWTVTAQATPGFLNTEENYRAMTTVTQRSPVVLAEIVASNTRFAPDENGVFQDYVVLRNTSGDPADIGGWYLSDDPALNRMWRFPDGIVIPAGGELVVHCSGLNRRENPAHLHTGFKLSSEGETVTLSNAMGMPVDIATYDLLRTDTALLRAADGSWSVGVPGR